MKLMIEVGIGVAILVILAVFLMPTHLLMPDSMNTLLLLALIVGFLSFIGLIWREQPSDERDQMHMHKAGRGSFFVGATILVIGVLFQALRHDIDPWLIYALAGMVLTKVITRMIQHFRN